MRILGLDPGLATTGYGLIEQHGSRSTAIDYGCVVTSKDLSTSRRLADLYQSMQQLLQQSKPDAVSIEKLFFNTNITTGVIVSQARGVILLAIHQAGLPVAEYTPLQVKMSICGYGMAKKPQVQLMTQTLLNLTAKPQPDDAADALAIALCHSSLQQLHQQAAFDHLKVKTGRQTV